MNYFEIINKCLMELNYQPCKTFVNLTKNDHLKIKGIINMINSEVCNSENWNFLLRQKDLILPANTGRIDNTIDGRICSLIIDNTKYNYSEDFDRFILNKKLSYKYSVFNDELLLPQFDSDKTVNIIYYTNNFGKDASSKDVLNLCLET